MKYTYLPQGTCSSQIVVDLDGDTIRDVVFTDGCSGNTQGVSALAKGKKVQDVIAALQGIRCGRKQTSCPDQLSIALQQALQAQTESENQ